MTMRVKEPLTARELLSSHFGISVLRDDLGAMSGMSRRGKAWCHFSFHIARRVLESGERAIQVSGSREAERTRATQVVIPVLGGIARIEVEREGSVSSPI